MNRKTTFTIQEIQLSHLALEIIERYVETGESLGVAAEPDKFPVLMKSLLDIIYMNQNDVEMIKGDVRRLEEENDLLSREIQFLKNHPSESWEDEVAREWDERG